MAEAYLTYAEYREMGGTLDSVAFSHQEFRAQKLIDQLTFGRVVNETPVREEVKYTVFALILVQSEEDSQGGREMSSVSIDGLSVSYSQQTRETIAARKLRLVKEYLGNEVTQDGIPLMYAGLDYYRG
jgi:hypothetical protein